MRDLALLGVTLRSGARAVTCCASALLLPTLLLAGCANLPFEPAHSSRGKVQVQFYAPPGAMVTVDGFTKYGPQQIDTYEDGHRLELTPEEFAVFNLTPRGWPYRFKYTMAEGLPGATVYGELDVHNPGSREARALMAHTFVPIAMASPYYGGSDQHFFPARGPSGAGLGQLEMEHLRQGDLITKVYFVADLKKAWHTIRTLDAHIERLRSAETVLNAHLEYVDARFQSYRRESLYADPTEDSLARHHDATGYNRKFIGLEAKRQELENERYAIRNQIDDLLNERRIRTRLLDSMRIINRQGSLVLATPENQWPFHDPNDQVRLERVYAGYATGPDEEYKTGDITIPPLGEVLLVMRVGGRHMHWGAPHAIAAADEPTASEWETIEYREEFREEPPRMTSPGTEIIE